MLPMYLAAFGTTLMAFIGYGCAISFMVLSLVGLLSALFRGRRPQGQFNRDMNSFVIAGGIAFLATFITVVALKLVG
jgi:hypothetical protein